MNRQIFASLQNSNYRENRGTQTLQTSRRLAHLVGVAAASLRAAAISAIGDRLAARVGDRRRRRRRRSHRHAAAPPAAGAKAARNLAATLVAAARRRRGNFALYKRDAFCVVEHRRLSKREAAERWLRKHVARRRRLQHRAQIGRRPRQQRLLRLYADLIARCLQRALRTLRQPAALLRRYFQLLRLMLNISCIINNHTHTLSRFCPLTVKTHVRSM